VTRPVRLRVENLSKHFRLAKPLLLIGPTRTLYAVDDVTFEITVGSTLALVGESGCGKSTVARNIVGLQSPTRGRILLDGRDVADRANRKAVRRSVQLISQNPQSSLNRRRSILHAIVQPLRVHHLVDSWSQQVARARSLLEQVGLSAKYLDRYPSEVSGGELQRVTIARALAVEPTVLILDEPTASLDLSVKAKLLNLLRELQLQLDLTILWITHELDVARHVSDQTAVMYLGKIIEVGPSSKVLRSPAHPYTQSLLASLAVPDPSLRSAFRPLQGEVPSPIDRPTGCTFHTRCPQAFSICPRVVPNLTLVGQQHLASCHLLVPSPQSAASSASSG